MPWITPDGEYYGGPGPVADGSKEVSERPSERHIWQGDEWVLGPVAPPRFVPLEFLNLFTEAEQLAVVQASLSNAAVKLWYDRVLAATYITLDDPRVEAGLDALVGAGLLTPERKLAVLAAMLESE